MRHCVDSYIGDCLGGETLIFSVRNVSDKRVATIGLRTNIDDGLWEVSDVRGFANCSVSPTLKRLASNLADHCQNLTNGKNTSFEPISSTTTHAEITSQGCESAAQS